MLLDLPAILVGVGLALVGFVVVLAVCIVVLRLLTVVLPPGPRSTAAEAEAHAGSAGDEAEPGEDGSTSVAEPDDAEADAPDAAAR